MSPSQLYKNRSPTWRDLLRLPKDFEELNSAYAAGDYTTAIDFLNSLLANITDQVNNAKRCEAREHILLARAMCFQQMREFQQVVSDTTEVVKITTMNGTSPPSVSVNTNASDDFIFCRMLALWLRSLAHESLENWRRAKDDLVALKTLILEKNKNSMIPFRTEGVLSVFLPHMTPLMAQYKVNSIIINLHCVDDRQRRMKDLVAKDARYNNASHAFRLIDEDPESYNDLAKKFHYRLLLRRPLHPNIHLDMWYTLDLMFVSEMGLFKREDLIGVQGYALGCKLLEINVDKESSERYEVQVRPMSAESREWSDCTDTDWAGVQNGGKGGLEFRVIRINKSPEFVRSNVCNGLYVSDISSDESNGFLPSAGLLSEKKNSQQLYLYVYPIQEIVNENYNNISEDFLRNDDINGNIRNSEESNRCLQENYLVPLGIGPIHIVNCEMYSNSCVHHLSSNGSNGSIFPEQRDVAIHPKSSLNSEKTATPVLPRKKSPWSIDDCLIDNYRGFILPNEKYLIIKELWDAGIPGKVWDSAFIIVRMIQDKIQEDQDSFVGKRILDLSSGTGFVGLYLASFLSTLQFENSEEKVHSSKTNMILTDLDYALKLIRENLALNKYILDSNNKVTIDVEELRWGDLPKAKKLGVLDYVLASDVVYEPDLFDSLIQTLIAVCTPGRTKMYLGYKRRGLTKDEETRFFGKLRNNFQVSVVQGLGNLAEEGRVNVYELSRK